MRGCWPLGATAAIDHHTGNINLLNARPNKLAFCKNNDFGAVSMIRFSLVSLQIGGRKMLGS